MRENRVERAVVRAAKEGGAAAPKLAGLGWRGWPDRAILARPGRILWVETKAPGKRPRPAQRVVHRLLRRLGFEVVVPDTPEEAREVVAQWLAGSRVDPTARR